MKGKREPLKAGSTLKLGETEYHIEGVEGSGGSVIVYRGTYQDRLNDRNVHRVLIKELFPWHPKGLVYRNADGSICWGQDAEGLVLRSRRQFYQGNHANLELLERMPGLVSDNLNSFEAYGTFYSVLSVHGGESLKKLLDAGDSFHALFSGAAVNPAKVPEPGYTLKDAAEAMIRILDSMKCFHKNGILHMDISPDNILMLPTYCLLIDYNSVWPMDRNTADWFYFSEKEGYTAPEVRLREEKKIGPATDLYSACAVFFRMLTGRRLTNEDIMGQGMRKCFPGDLGVFRDQPASAAYKAVQIVGKGLHVLPGKRYQSVDELRGDLKELIRRIDGKGISYSTIWEGSVRELKRWRRSDERYLERSVQIERKAEISEGECFLRLFKGGRILLIGAGGMGKTRFLLRLWEREMKEYKRGCPILLYIPLADYQECKDEPAYIRKYILRHFCFFGQQDTFDMALHELDCLLEAKQTVQFILLLDGLNEAGVQTRHLLKEIEQLGRLEKVGIVVTDRTDSVKKYAFRGFQTVRLMPLAEETVEKELAEVGGLYSGALRQNGSQKTAEPLPEDAGLLTNPMMLSLYLSARRMADESGRAEDTPHSLVNMDDVIRYYLENLCTRELRKASGDQAEQLRRRYLLEHLLPEIAAGLKRRRKTLFTLEELYGLVGRFFYQMQGKSFALAFPEYMGKSRLIFQGIANEREWFDYAISEQLIGNLSLLEENAEGSYSLTHDSFARYLERVSFKNKKRFNRCKRKTMRRRACIGLLFAAGLGAAGTAMWKTGAPRQLSQEEGDILFAAMQRLEMNLMICNMQINSQKTVLEYASGQGVLAGEPEKVREFLEVIDAKLDEAEAEYKWVREGTEHLHQLEQLNMDLPLGVVKELYEKPVEMDGIMKAGIGCLAERLSDAKSVYDTYEKRFSAVNAYQEYLDAYSSVCYLEFSQVLFKLKEAGAEEAADELMAGIGEMSSFWECIDTYSLGGMGEDDIIGNRKAAERRLEAARTELKAQNMKLE